eukprot:jgi/Mesen1/1083/ME000123S00257
MATPQLSPKAAGNGPLSPRTVNPFIGDRQLGLPSYGIEDEEEASANSPIPMSLRAGEHWLHEAAARLSEKYGPTVRKHLEGILEWPIAIHVAVAVLTTWLLGRLHVNFVLAVTWMIVLLWLVVNKYMQREEAMMRSRIKRETLAGNPVSDEETARWLNTTVSHAWNVWLERLVAVKIAPQMAPWFLDTYAPFPLKKLELKALGLGKDPPCITSVRVYQQPAEGDHLTMEMNVEMVCGKEMSAQFAAHVHGMGTIPWTAYTTNLHLMRASVRFLNRYPYIARVGVSFLGDPRLSTSIKVLGMGFGKGFDAGYVPLVTNFVTMEMNVEMVCGKEMSAQFAAHVHGMGTIPWTAYTTNLHLMRASVRFLNRYPYIARVGVSFLGDPRLSTSIKVLGMGFGKGFDAGYVPLVTNFVDATIKRAVNNALVAPNELVVEDLVELLSLVVDPPGPTLLPSDGLSKGIPPGAPAERAGAGEPVAYVLVQIIEGEQLVAKDVGGLSDPYVKGAVGTAKFQTSIKRSTLSPRWNEEFRVPVLAWLQPRTPLRLVVRDYDRVTEDDEMGVALVDLNALRKDEGAGEGVARREMWLDLDEVPHGRLHVTLTLLPNDPEAAQETEAALEDGQMAAVKLERVADNTLAATLKSAAHMAGPKVAQGAATTRRAVHVGNPKVKVGPGTVIYRWD